MEQIGSDNGRKLPARVGENTASGGLFRPLKEKEESTRLVHFGISRILGHQGSHILEVTISCVIRVEIGHACGHYAKME